MTTNSELDRRLLAAAEEIGTPAYVYFKEPIEARIADLRRAFDGRFELSFAVKSNPNPALLNWLRDLIEDVDVSSIGELRTVCAAGWQAKRASFTGPGKRSEEISEALSLGVGELVLESVREATEADRLARLLGQVQDVLVRIGPAHIPKGFGDQMAGRPSSFGIDVESVEEEFPRILRLEGLRVVGFHIYSGTQCLKADALCANYREFIRIFRDLAKVYDLKPLKLVFGSGLGIPYHSGDVPLDLDAVASGINGDLDDLRNEPRFTNARFVLELGRYLVGEAGYFLTRVIAIKRSRGAHIGICDGGMNAHLPASGNFGMVIHRNYPMHKVAGNGPLEKINLVGPLCTSIDRLAVQALLPRIKEGDLIAVHNSGAYGLTASPIHFIGHPQPREVLMKGDMLQDVSRNFGPAHLTA